MRRFTQWPKGLLGPGCLHQLQMKNKPVCMFMCHTPVTPLLKSTYLLIYLLQLKNLSLGTSIHQKKLNFVFISCNRSTSSYHGKILPISFSSSRLKDEICILKYCVLWKWYIFWSSVMCICQNTQSQRYYSEILSNPVRAHALNFSMSKNPVFVFFNFPLTIYNISLMYTFQNHNNGTDCSWTEMW